VVAVGVGIRQMIGKPAPQVKKAHPVAVPSPRAAKTAPAIVIPPYEIFPKTQPAVPPQPEKPVPPVADRRPRVAIIIDDIGYDRKIANDFLALKIPLTFSVLPFSPFGRKIAEAAHLRGTEIMLHLPMEPVEYPRVNPGPGGLLTSMGPDVLIAQLDRDLDDIGMAQGVNNHMGSRMTTQSNQMRQIFSILKKRHLFFIDSLTTANSVCRPSARLFQVPFAQRDVFLDNVQNPVAIARQIQRLVEIARHRGQAVGIGHPHPATFRALFEALPKLGNEVLLVPASEVVHLSG
jgi:polysaccharide deacetylase 2 family uncharacterized protein YibQ